MLEKQDQNHCLALQKRYYRLLGRHISEKRMKKHISRLRKSRRYAYWKDLGSQAVQDVIERLERAYERFFNKQGGLPRFKKVKRYKSFILKQTAACYGEYVTTTHHFLIGIR